MLTGDLYRIDSPKYTNYFSFAVVVKDKKCAFLTCYDSFRTPLQCHQLFQKFGLQTAVMVV